MVRKEESIGDSPRLKRNGSVNSDLGYLTTDSEASDGDMKSVTSEDEKTIYNEMLREVPVGWVVAKLLDENDMMSFVIVAGNPIYEAIMKTPLDQMIGKPVTDLHPPMLANDCELLRKNFLIAKTGETIDLPAFEVDDAFLGKMTVRLKYIGLPNLAVLSMFEQLHDADVMKKRRQDIRSKLEDIMDRSLDRMLDPAVQEKEDEALESQILRSVLAFGDVSDSDILVSDKESLITAADIGTLIRNLAEAKEDFIDQFLITYRYFITPKALLNKLILKYISQTNDEVRIDETRQKLTKVFRAWIKDHYYDFDVDPELLSSLTNFVNEHATHLQKLLSKQTTQSCVVIDDSETAENQARKSSSRILNLFKRKSTLINFDATAIAHQLTLLCFQRFKNIKPVELHSQSWSKQNKQVISPNVVAMVNHFNLISNLFQYEIVSQRTLKKRVAALQHVINIGWAAYGYRDYETTFTVVLSLASFPISRLAETWKGLPTTSRQQWDLMEQFCHYKDNYKRYRSHLRKSVNMVPYMGLFLKDLTNIDENDTITSVGAVNFFKMRKVAQVISTIQRTQQSIFNFQQNLKITSFISFEVPSCDENDLWEMSLQCEKETDTERAPNQRKLLDILTPTQLITTSSNPIFGLNQPKSPNVKKK
eukprot:TRINITY_DN2193_c0_g2_i7.p1 TRINITY_DN2193_c0_g2~~TRINITY_DN2193_c0_g2_i7.p1  ORF type:complete len:650 (-),score=183.05 TRINITY_DN2193_c0_g2_i7:59-2008(-)